MYAWDRKDLSVKPLIQKKTNSSYNFIPSPLPKPPFRMLVVGASGSGKTNLIMNLITRFLTDSQNESIFNEIYCFAASALQDQAFQSLGAPHIKNKVYLSNNLETDLIEGLINSEDKKTRLIYIDDFAGSLASVKSEQNEVLFNLWFRSRHSGTSLIFSSQYYYSIPIALRTNSSHMILFKSQSKREESLIKAELQTKDFAGDDFDTAFYEATKEPYSFLYIDRYTYGSPKFYVRFEFEIEPPENDEESDEEDEDDEEEEDHEENSSNQKKESIDPKVEIKSDIYKVNGEAIKK